MKRFVLLFCMVLMTTFTFAKENIAEATVNFKRTEKGIEYTISFIPGFKYNHEAPFRFNLMNSKKEILSKVAFKDFYKTEDEDFKYSTKGNEKFVNYWFVACKYVDGQITGCKTFTKTLEIK